MSALPPTGRELASRRIWSIVSARAAGADPQLWEEYKALARQLPHLVRHNGLPLAVGYLRKLAFERKRDAAKALLSDWASQRGALEGLALAHLIADKSFDYRGAESKVLADRLAEREADLFKRYVEVVSPSTRTVVQASSEPPMWSLATEPALQDEHLSHPGLFWRFGGDVSSVTLDEFRKKQVSEACRRASREAAGERYPLVFERRRRWLESRASAVRVETVGRLFLALGDRGVFETQAQLHPLTGLPYISSSALKSRLKRHLLSAAEHHPDGPSRQGIRRLAEELLGSEVREGQLILHDAWWVPSSAPSPLVGDIDTPEHSAYYAGKVDEAKPSDDPEPNVQLAVVGQFDISVDHTPVGKRWAGDALKWLCRALRRPGLGGRQAVGGGRMRQVM